MTKYRKKPVEVAVESKYSYFIRGLDGVLYQLYPCKPDIFAKTYEEVSD